ncbi:tetratricopeptide repeat protein [Lentzea sp. NPDC004782]|uniref:tetratricopeptide repeat protein n=1 Tax=Lentzea sp. NPDC004782 TaxID=3154458 RepID=UPI0033A69A97
MRNQDLPLSASFRGLPAVPADQVVTGLIPHEPPNFQTPPALALLSSPVCVLTGPRGVGKTQVAAALARQRVLDGWLVAWIGAETPDQIRAGLVELADRLGLYQPEDSPEIIAARVRNHLQTRSGPALLVFDNVVSLDAIKPYLPSVGPAQVVITSTSRGSQIGDEVPVEVFSPETALQFLRDATGLDDPLAAELAAEVGYLPLALAQAAARIRAARWNFAKYLENFRKFPAEKQLSRRDGDPYPLGAATAILMALEPFQDNKVMGVLSVLSPDGVSREILGDEVDDELVALHDASLVEFAGDSSVIMHRLVQRVIRDRSQGGDAVLDAIGLLTYRISLVGNDLWKQRQISYELVRQIEALWPHVYPASPLEVAEPAIALRLWEVTFLGRHGYLSLAAALVETTYQNAIACLGDDHPLVHNARQAVAFAGGAGAETLVNELRTKLGEEKPVTLTTVLMLSRCYRTLARTDEAIAVLEQAMEQWRDQPLSDADCEQALFDLAQVYLEAERAEEAVAVLEDIIQKQPAERARDSTTIDTLSALGDAYGMSGRHQDALLVHERAWTAYQETFGPDHPLTLVGVAKLGMALFVSGQAERARSMLESALVTALTQHGDGNVVTAMLEAALESIQQD